MVRKLGNIYLKQVDSFSYCKLPAESAEMHWMDAISRLDDMHSGGSETEMSQSLWMQMIIHRNLTLAVNNDCMNIVYNC